MSRVLITGVAGFIGMHTAIRFLEGGWEVIGLDNCNNYYDVALKESRLLEIRKFSANNSGEFVFYKEDLNSNIWVKLKKIKFDLVIHLAAQAGVRYSITNPRAYLESNILGFQSVLDFVSSTSTTKFLYASSSSVYGKNSIQPFNEESPCDSPESYYAATKRANELMAKSYYCTHGISSIGLRFFTVYGPWGRPDMAPMLFAKSSLNDEAIRVFNFGKQSRDFTYIKDIVEGIFLLGTLSDFPCDALVCNIGNGSPVNLMDFISILEKSLNKKIKRVLVPAQKGDVDSTHADTTLLESLIDYKPLIGLEEGIPVFVEWYKTYYPNIKD